VEQKFRAVINLLKRPAGLKDRAFHRRMPTPGLGQIGLWNTPTLMAFFDQLKWAGIA
jgi:hypothetical protein